MNHKLWWSVGTVSVALLLSTVFAVQPTEAVAKPRAGKAKTEAPKSGSNLLKHDIRLSPEGLRWGIPLQMVSKVYDDYFDASYVERYKKAEPGTETNALDAEVSDKKALIKRNRLEFGSTPTGVDQGPLKGEYSYNNGESMTKVLLPGGTQRYFFFFNDKLWKVYDEYKLGPSSKLGTTFEDALKALNAIFGGEPILLEPDYAHGRSFPEAIWVTSSMHIRAVNRDYQKIVAVVYADRSIQDNLARHRPNKLADPTAMDHAVRDATTKAPEPPPSGKNKK